MHRRIFEVEKISGLTGNSSDEILVHVQEIQSANAEVEELSDKLTAELKRTEFDLS